MKRKTTIIALSTLIVFSSSVLAASTIAWFSARTNIPFGTDPDTVNVSGGSMASYYESGTGRLPGTNGVDDPGDPYVISNKNHLYNLAWLQYIGYYNARSTIAQNPEKDFEQCYFVLKNDIDMDGMTLPPIGTEKYPFLGSFNGAGHTVSNFTISNDDPEEDDSDFGVAKPSDVYGGKPSDVIGFFGVVGQIPGKTLPNTYNPDIVSVSDFAIEDFTVVSKSKTNKALIGLAAGFVDGSMSGVKVKGDAELDLGNTAKTAVSSDITSNLSDYGLVGYTTRKGNDGSYLQKLSEHYSNFNTSSSGSSGQGNDWGGSIDMLSLYGRLSSIYNSDAYDSGSYSSEKLVYPDGTTEYNKTEDLNNHYSGIYDADYSYTFNKQHYGNQDIYFMYGDYSPVSGQKTETTYNFSTKTVSGNELTIKQDGTDKYYFSYTLNNTTYYLKVPDKSSSTSPININTTSYVSTNINDARRFDLRISGGYYYFYYNETYQNTLYYSQLALSGSNLRIVYNQSLSTGYNQYRFVKDGNNYKTLQGSTYYFVALIRNGNNYYFNGSTSGSAYRATTTAEQGVAVYLTADSNGTVFSVANENSAVRWFHDGDNHIYTLFNNTIYFLIGTTSSVSVTNKVAISSATEWTYGNNAIYCTINSTRYYFNFNPSPTMSTSQGTNITETSKGSVSYSNQLYASSVNVDVTNNPSSFKNSYFPISVTKSNKFSTSNKNTGYIISGKSFINPNYDSGGEPTYNNSGDIRVARYSMDNISSSLGQTTFDNSKLFAITATSNSDYALITDSYNASSSASSSLDDIDDTVESSTLNRYDDWDTNTGARVALGNVFTNDSSNIYGLHFMNATISANNTVVVPNAVINGRTYRDGLEMPKDSIDFFVEKSGFITFFAGTYYSGNSAFFSLHKITRDSSNNISNITEIQNIYKDNANNYYYNLNNPGNSYTKVFDTAVLTNPTSFINNAVYYFEIPVSAGEYALGSVSGKDGAYLMYLDISASGEEILKDKVISYWINTKTDSSVYPSGVDFAPVAIGANGGESIGVYISSGKSGNIVFSVSSAEIEIKGTESIAQYAFQGNKYSSSSPPDGKFSVTGNSLGSMSGPASGGTRVLTIDLVTVNETHYVAKITDNLNANGTIASSSFQLDSGSGFVDSSKASIDALSEEVDIDTFRALNLAATLTRTAGNGAFTTTYDSENSFYDDKIIDVDIELNNSTISISVENGYTFKIGGVTYPDGSTYPAS